MYYIYRYLDNRDQSIIYMGKTKRILSKRIEEHTKDLKFIPHLPYCKIQYYIVYSHVQMDIHEKYWIHEYQPKLNVTDRFEGEESIDLGLKMKKIHWLDYKEEYFKQEERKPEIQTQTKSGYEDLHVLDIQYLNADTFLEYSFEQYINETAERDGSKIGFIWDLNTNPLPDSILISDIDHPQWYSFYTQAVFSPAGTILWNTEQNMRILWKYGKSAIQRERRNITNQLLDKVI